MKFIFYLFFYFAAVNSIFSNSIFFEDVELERGKTNLIPILIENVFTENYPIDLELELVFNAYMFEINNVRDIVPTNTTNYEVVLNLDDLSRSILKINSRFNQPNNTLFILQVTGLASKDSVSSIELFSIKLNNQVVDDIGLRSGRITLNNLVFDLESSVSEVYPNPFDFFTQVDLDIKKETMLNLKIFDNSSRSLNTVLGTDAFKVTITDEQNNNIEYEENVSLEVGKYKVILAPRRTNISIGAYRLVIKLDNDIFYKNFIYGG